MNTMEGSSTHLSKPSSSQSLNSVTTSTVDVRNPGQRWPYDEEEMMRYSVAEQEQIAMEDLKAFGSRLRELDTESRPRDAHWAPLLGTIFACTAISVCHWVPRVRESQSIVLRGLSSRSAFTISLATLVLTVLYGLKHIVDRKRNGAVLSTDTLTLFQLECDKKGELVGISKNGLSSMPLNSQ